MSTFSKAHVLLLVFSTCLLSIVPVAYHAGKEGILETDFIMLIAICSSLIPNHYQAEVSL